MRMMCVIFVNEKYVDGGRKPLKLRNGVLMMEGIR